MKGGNKNQPETERTKCNGERSMFERYGKIREDTGRGVGVSATACVIPYGRRAVSARIEMKGGQQYVVPKGRQPPSSSTLFAPTAP